MGGCTRLEGGALKAISTCGLNATSQAGIAKAGGGFQVEGWLNSGRDESIDSFRFVEFRSTTNGLAYRRKLGQRTLQPEAPGDLSRPPKPIGVSDIVDLAGVSPGSYEVWLVEEAPGASVQCNTHSGLKVE